MNLACKHFFKGQIDMYRYKQLISNSEVSDILIILLVFVLFFDEADEA